MIVFDPITHTYILNGQPVPSVTTILKDMNFIDTTWFTDYGRDRGKLVHKIIHWHITGELDESTIDPELQGYFDAWKAFEDASGFVSTETEKPLASELYRFAGTPDIIGKFKDYGEVFDIKTGPVAPWTGLQLAAYEILAGRPLKRYALQLNKNGKYSLKPFAKRQDRQIFLAALACWWWQKNNNMRGRG